MKILLLFIFIFTIPLMGHAWDWSEEAILKMPDEAREIQQRFRSPYVPPCQGKYQGAKDALAKRCQQSVQKLPVVAGVSYYCTAGQFQAQANQGERDTYTQICANFLPSMGGEPYPVKGKKTIIMLSFFQPVQIVTVAEHGGYYQAELEKVMVMNEERRKAAICNNLAKLLAQAKSLGEIEVLKKLKDKYDCHD